jgi:hypothetical protein
MVTGIKAFQVKQLLVGEQAHGHRAAAEVSQPRARGHWECGDVAGGQGDLHDLFLALLGVLLGEQRQLLDKAKMKGF